MIEGKRVQDLKDGDLAVFDPLCTQVGSRRRTRQAPHPAVVPAASGERGMTQVHRMDTIEHTEWRVVDDDGYVWWSSVNSPRHDAEAYVREWASRNDDQHAETRTVTATPWTRIGGS
jgi:hypothetical protein